MSREPHVRRGMPTPGVAAPADRRFRRADAPVRRRRGGRTWGAVARAVGVAVALALTATWGGRRLVASDVFLVREIVVRGNEWLSVGEVESLLTGLRDENLLLVDFERYRDRVMDSSWVEQVSLSRVLPSTIVVDVVERTPMALGRLNQVLYLVDRTGKIIDEHRGEYHRFDLPIVDGLLSEQEDGGAGPDARARVTVLLFDELSARRDLQQRVSQIDVSDPRDVVVMLDDDSTWLHLGEASFVDRLQRYLDLRPALADRFGSVEYVDLKYDERVYVRGRGQQTPRPVTAQ